MRNPSKVGVIMCMYHADCPYKAKIAIDSIISQSLSNKVYLYIDGPIPKELFDVIKSYKDIYTYFSKDNCGLAVGLNFLIDVAIKAEHEFIARMDSDDISYPTRLEQQVRFFSDNPNVDVVGTGFREYGSSVSREGVLLPEDHESLIDFAITRCPFMHPTVMFRASCFESGLRYPLGSDLSEDLALWHIMLQEGYVFHNLQEVLLDFYIDKETITRRGGFQKARSEFKLRYSFMQVMKRFSLRSLMTLVVKFMSQNLPVTLLYVVYKYFR